MGDFTEPSISPMEVTQPLVDNDVVNEGSEREDNTNNEMWIVTGMNEHRKKEYNSPKNIVSYNIHAKSQYYERFMQEVKFVKDKIREDIEGYKHIRNDYCILNFLQLAQQLQKNSRYVLKKMDRQLYKTK